MNFFNWMSVIIITSCIFEVVEVPHWSLVILLVLNMAPDIIKDILNNLIKLVNYITKKING